MAIAADLIAIAWDVAQESCYYIPISIPKSIARRHYVFEAATAVKEIANVTPSGEEPEEKVANLVLHGALVVEYAAKFSTNSATSMSAGRRNIKNALKCIAPGELDCFETETYKSGLIDALADDLQVDKQEVSQSIESSFKRHSVGAQEAETFIQDNPDWDCRNPNHVANLRQFLNKNSVSFLALRSVNAIKFLDILEQAENSDFAADDKWLYQMYLRRLSYRSKELPTSFHLSDVEISPCEHKQCVHSGLGGLQESFEGGFGKVRRAKWRKPNGTVADVAIKALRLKVRDLSQKMLCHEAAFWYYLDRDKVIPFYGVAVVDNSSCLVSLWMDGGRICCYVDGKNDSIRLDLLRQVAEGIKYLHNLSFVHCDIKPANILINAQEPPKALITDFGCSNAARRTNVDYSGPGGYTPGFVRDRAKRTPWDPRDDVYAFGVTCCQVVLVGTRQDIASIPEDIETCMSQLLLVPDNSNGDVSMVDAHQIWERLRRKFFPTKNKSPPPFIDEIFHLVAKTCIPTCKMDDVFNLLKEADHSADYAIIEPIISKADAWTDVAPIEPSNSLAEFKSLSQQPGQSTQPLANTYDDRLDQQACSAYLEGSLQPQSSGQRDDGSHSPHMRNVPSPEQQHDGSTTSHPSKTKNNAGTQQRGDSATIQPSHTTHNTSIQQHGGSTTIRPSRTTHNAGVQKRGGSATSHPSQTKQDVKTQQRGNSTTIQPSQTTTHDTNIQQRGGSATSHPSQTTKNTSIQKHGGSATIRTIQNTVQQRGGSAANSQTTHNAGTQQRGDFATIHPSQNTSIQQHGGSATIRTTHNTGVQQRGGPATSHASQNASTQQRGKPATIHPSQNTSIQQQSGSATIRTTHNTGVQQRGSPANSHPSQTTHNASTQQRSNSATINPSQTTTPNTSVQVFDILKRPMSSPNTERGNWSGTLPILQHGGSATNHPSQTTHNTSIQQHGGSATIHPSRTTYNTGLQQRSGSATIHPSQTTYNTGVQQLDSPTIIRPSQATLANSTAAAHHQYEHRDEHGHPGSSSDSLGLYPGAVSDTGSSGSNFYSPQPGVQPHYGGGYNATVAQNQDIYQRQGSHGHSGRLSTDSLRYPGTVSDTGGPGVSNFHLPQPGVQPHHGGYNATVAQHQDVYQRQGSHGHSGQSSSDSLRYPDTVSDTGGPGISNFHLPQPGVQPYHGGYNAIVAQYQGVYEPQGSHGHSGQSSSDSLRYPGTVSDTGGPGISNFHLPQPEVQPHHGGYNATVAQYQGIYEPQGSHGHSGRSSTDSLRYPGAVSDDGGPGGSNFHSQPGVQPPHHGGGYTATAVQHQEQNRTVHERHDYYSTAPPHGPAGTSNAICRYPHCNNYVYFDMQRNVAWEWCGVQHMWEAGMACIDCGVRPRRDGYESCGGNVCRYPGY